MQVMPPYVFLRSRLFLWFIRPVIFAVLVVIGLTIGVTLGTVLLEIG